jgi:hypothetical protein
MGTRMHKLLLAAALLLGAAPALAQTSPAPAEDDNVITVTGSRDVKKTVQEFVAALAPGRTARPLNRFEREVCPLVLGLPQRQADLVAARIRRIAGEIDMKVGAKGCGPNLFVMITADKRKLLAEMRRGANEAFGSLSNDKIRALSRQPGAAVVWHSEGPPIGRDGKEAALQENSDGSSYHINRTTEAASRLVSGGTRQFASATVVVEKKALDGLTVTQLADYAAFRAFTGADPTRLKGSSVPTILQVLDADPDAEVAPSLTEWDLAFLDGFYGMSRGLNASGQRSSIAREVEKKVTGQR